MHFVGFRSHWVRCILYFCMASAWHGWVSVMTAIRTCSWTFIFNYSKFLAQDFESSRVIFKEKNKFWCLLLTETICPFKDWLFKFLTSRTFTFNPLRSNFTKFQVLTLAFKIITFSLSFSFNFFFSDEIHRSLEETIH